MRFDVNVYHHIVEVEPVPKGFYASVLATLKEITKKENLIMADLSVLEAQVKANSDVEASAILLIQGIAAKLAEAATDPAKIQALSDELKASADSLAAAVAANT